ncbi:TonB-dependent receptor plug domain-containing protein [Geomesophilobacter sediminis]|uniref:TonB-dependent receptor n=1 Tax=Geomesophilobacter sediminis TaxID=2798584 RepID=A0A8J7M347_9BACT|nr:TonB-dependent receptor [Geomesophilobacter sediminis]MBJ6727798.1 TonB-dependent receptor [Geomesophilobacter sediminis]
MASLPCRLTVLISPVLRKTRLALALMLLLSASRAQAAVPVAEANQDLTEMTLEQLMEVEVPTVIGASKYEQKVTEAPASVSIVTAEDIRRYGYRTLADALNSVRGLYITYDRNYHFLGIRGFGRPGDYNSRVLMLVDGHRINDNIFDTAPIGTEFPLDLDLIDRIEVIRGPGSSLYGTNAFFGVINVITRQGSDLQGAETAAAAGRFATYNGRASYGKEFANGLDLLLSASVMHSDGPQRLFFKSFDRPALHDGTAVDLDGDRNCQLFAKGSWRDFTLMGAYATRTKQIPTASFGTVFGVPGTETTDAHGFFDLKFVHNLPDQGQLTARLFFDHYYYQGNYLFDQNNPDNTADPTQPPLLVPNRDVSRGTWWGTEVQYTRSFLERMKLSLGGEFRDNVQQRQENYDVNPYRKVLDDSRSSTIWALYLQDDLQLLRNLILSAGVRHDHYDTFGGSWNPRVGLIYEPIPGSVGKLLYGEAFRAPNAFELYYEDQVSGKANPGLKPEKIRTYEAVYEQYFQEHLQSSLSAFYYRIQDLITQVDIGGGMSQYQNVDSVDARGIEAELEGKWDGGYQARGSYTWQRAEDARTGATLTNSPRHLAKLNLTAPLYREILFAGVEEQYSASRLTVTPGSSTGGYFITNLTLFSRGIVPGLELSASVYNLLDRHYTTPSFNNVYLVNNVPTGPDRITQDGRTFRVKLQYLF